ncbi:ATP-binding protein [Dinoroseobacter sp. PD6]|uniref:sensor histidine kinase n=1 Tax=Dinoroseobacter sp. PD6 TaxID=3028384 RepID=UPI00237A71D1|nr:ATP-binding protein [Dinoroseobacter sp. PD6]MDD9717465.1 ATP-binding protein [Dinoroseobacter sp. PD6]
MQRFDLDQDRLLPGAEILFYDPGVWEEYWAAILLAFPIILLQSSTIIGLGVLEKRRRRAAAELAQQRAEVARLSRVSQLGELSGAIAHELKQPLTSILMNAESGRALLRQSPPDLREIAEILEDIANDDRRAAGVIDNLRKLLGEGAPDVQPVELNDVVRATLRLIRSELIARSVRTDLKLCEAALIATGNAEQLQQVLLNLIFNATDGMADQPRKTRRISIETTLRTDGMREVSVTDTGPGLPEAVRDAAFQPFVTTKAHGMGLGLSISRTIAEAHGGQLHVDGAASKTRAILALPAP